MTNADQMKERGIVHALFDTIYPQKWENRVAGSLDQARDHLRSDGGLSIFFSHMTKDDLWHTLKFISRNFPDSAQKPLVAPIARHTYQSLKPGITLASLVSRGVEWAPLVTKKTIAEGKGKSTVEGLRHYLDQSTQALASGGIVVSALEAGGNLQRYGDQTTVFSTLARAAERKGIVSKVGALFLGLVPKDSVEHEGKRAHGRQFFRPMHITIGGFARLSDVIARVGDRPSDLDHWAHEEMKAILPEWYTKP